MAKNTLHTAYLITGGNMGDRGANLRRAAQYLAERVGKIVLQSSLFETEAWGNTQQPSFYNQVLIIKTALQPQQLMHALLQIEKEMGRIRTVKNAARLIDIDMLYYDEIILDTEEVILPHKEIANRRFVLKPLVEVAPDYIHPVLLKSNSQLLKECKDVLEANPL